MTSVSIDETFNTVVVEDDTKVIVVEEETGIVIQLTSGGPQGPAGTQGPPGPSGSSTLMDLTDVNVVGRVDKNVLRYDASSDKWIDDYADNLITLTDGGNF